MASKWSYFYVLLCKDGSYYGGYTTELERREKEHNTGVGAKYTKPAYRRPLKMIYAEAFLTRSEATKAEYAFKKLSKAKKTAFLKDNGVIFPVNGQKGCVISLRHIERLEEEADEHPEKL